MLLAWRNDAVYIFKETPGSMKGPSARYVCARDSYACVYVWWGISRRLESCLRKRDAFMRLLRPSHKCYFEGHGLWYSVSQHSVRLPRPSYAVGSSIGWRSNDTGSLLLVHGDVKYHAPTGVPERFVGALVFKSPGSWT